MIKKLCSICIVGLLLYFPGYCFAATYGSGVYGSGIYNQGQTATPAPSDTGVSSNPSLSGSSGNCSDSAPTTSPELFQADVQMTSVTLYINPHGNFDKYIVMYGFRETDERYSAIIQVNPTVWVLPIQIEALSPATSYYFKVKAIHGCAYSSYSNSLSIQTTSNASQMKTFYKYSDPVHKTTSTIASKISSITTKPTIIQTPPSPQENQRIQKQTGTPPAAVKPVSPSPQPTGLLHTIVSIIKTIFGL